jgi:hypothetical protein
MLISTSKILAFLIIAYVSSSTKLEKRTEQVLPGSERGGGKREGVGNRGEKWSQQCEYIRINEERKKEHHVQNKINKK